MAFKRVSIDEAKALIDTGEVTIGDVRAVDAYHAGHIANAIHVQAETMDHFLSQAHEDKPLILYCYHGNSSQGAANYFCELGYTQVYSMDGGYEAWRLKYQVASAIQ
ncbi:MAG: thiosulfate sulfurtransferase GlpE [Halioglobus sp.]